MKRFPVFVVLMLGVLLGSRTAGAPPQFGGLLAAWVASMCVADASQQAPQAVPLSALPLQLLAVMVNKTTPARSVCLIRCASPAGKQGTFSTGQRACDLAEIKEIRGDGVIITNLLSDRLERLPFSNAQPVPDAQPPRTVVPTPPNQISDPVSTPSPDVVAVDISKDSLDRSLDNLPELLDSALATPQYRPTTGGPPVMQGYEISRIVDASLVQRLGFKNGDVVTEVNGQPLDGLAAVTRLLGQIRTMPQATVVVLRNGQRMTFTFNLK